MDSDVGIKELLLQWIKGDKIGNVEKVVSQDNEWTTFEGGSRIATELINEFMIPIEGEPLDLSMSTETQRPKVQRHTAARKTETLQVSPIKTLFDKQKKTDKVDLKFSFSINVPTKEIFDIISMTFDKDEVIVELDSFISSQINSELLKDTLRTSIEELIANRYKDSL